MKGSGAVSWQTRPMAPRIGLTTWRRELATSVHPRNDLFTLSATYVTAVERAGGIPLLLPFADDTTAGDLVEALDGLVVTGGRDVDPANYGHENTRSFAPDAAADASDLAIVRAALAARLPTLYICRGVQILNVALGGTLHQHMIGDSDAHPRLPRTDDAEADATARWAFRHRVTATAGSELATVFDDTSIDTNSAHHQALDAIAPGLTVTGRTADGHVEAVEMEGQPLIAVQWHPERQLDDGHDVLFEWVVARAGGPT